MIHKCETTMRMDPDSPLNRAHQMERQAERLLSLGQWQRATVLYEEAAEHLQVALQQTQNPAALLSLKLQLDSLRKQPQLIAKRQQWSLQKQESVLTVWNGRFDNDDATPDSGPGLVCDNGGRAVEPGRGREEEEEDGRIAEVEAGRLRTGSLESDYSAEEADSLLAVIRQHRVVENEQPRYRLTQLLQGFRALSLGRRRDQPQSEEGGPAGEGGQQAPTRTLVEELLQQNRELQGHLVQLFQVLDSCERENQQLKRSVADLNQQLEDYRVLHAGGNDDRFGIGRDARLDAPFSMVDGFACTPPPESLPPLSPLLLPDFECMEDMN